MEYSHVQHRSRGVFSLQLPIHVISLTIKSLIQWEQQYRKKAVAIRQHPVQSQNKKTICKHQLGSKILVQTRRGAWLYFFSVILTYFYRNESRVEYIDPNRWRTFSKFWCVHVLTIYITIYNQKKKMLKCISFTLSLSLSLYIYIYKMVAKSIRPSY